MVLEINRDSNTFIYEQLEFALYNKIIKGELKPGDMIPSVREVARHNGINPNTVQKAFAELIRAGVIFSVAGKGNYISPDAMDIKRDEKAEILKELRYIARRAKISGIWMDELITVLVSSYNE